MSCIFYQHGSTAGKAVCHSVFRLVLFCVFESVILLTGTIVQLTWKTGTPDET